MKNLRCKIQGFLSFEPQIFSRAYSPEIRSGLSISVLEKKKRVYLKWNSAIIRFFLYLSFCKNQPKEQKNLYMIGTSQSRTDFPDFEKNSVKMELAAQWKAFSLFTTRAYPTYSSSNSVLHSSNCPVVNCCLGKVNIAFIRFLIGHFLKCFS